MSLVVFRGFRGHLRVLQQTNDILNVPSACGDQRPPQGQWQRLFGDAWEWCVGNCPSYYPACYQIVRDNEKKRSN
jgi:hypothetical protein